jgi:hypothetical protein
VQHTKQGKEEVQIENNEKSIKKNIDQTTDTTTPNKVQSGEEEENNIRHIKRKSFAANKHM